MTDELIDEMRRRIADPFPECVEKGLDYGEVDAVVIGADVYGWAQTASTGSGLTSVDRERLRDAAEELRRSMPAFPVDARPYFERVPRIAELAFAR